MKKTVKLMGMAILLGAVAFLGSSCKKNDPATSIKVSLPVVEELSIDGEKAYIDFSDGNQMKWSAGDEIMFYNLFQDYSQSVAKVYGITDGVGEHYADFFGGDMGSEKGDWGYYAFYPAAKVKNYPLQPGNRQYFDVPDFQTYNKTSMDPTSLVMAAHGDDILSGHFLMKHIFGFVNMKLKGTKAVSSIVIRDNYFNLNGRISANLPYVNESTLSTLIAQCADYTVDFDNTYMVALNNYLHGDLGYMSEPQGKYIRLDCSANGGVQLNNSTYTNFYITLRPGALAKGFVVEVTYTNGDVDIIKKFDPTSSSWAYGAYPQYPRGFCVRPGTVLNFKGN